MKNISLIYSILKKLYGSADPNLFGSNKRRDQKFDLADEYKTMAKDSQGAIDEVKTYNPFESAGAKEAMKVASRNARLMQQRTLNTMGANASSEAVIAAQGQTTEALGDAAGSIATGAEANRKNEEARLRNEKQFQMGQYGAIKGSGIDEIGKGWETLFQSIDNVGGMAAGAGQAAALLI